MAAQSLYEFLWFMSKDYKTMSTHHVWVIRGVKNISTLKYAMQYFISRYVSIF